MPRLNRFTVATLLVSIIALAVGTHSLSDPTKRSVGDSGRPEIAYLKVVNDWRPPDDPAVLFILMGQFANAGRYEEGIDYFERLLSRFEKDASAPMQALYLDAIAALRAGHANDVPVFRRIGWVRDTLKMLDRAKQMAGPDAYVPRWMSGVIRAQMPAILGERDATLDDLAWCETHADRAPHAAWLREVYFQRAALLRARGDTVGANRYQALSGLPAGNKPVLFSTPFSEDATGGHTFSPRLVREVVPGTVYVVSGYEFTEYYFVVSADRRELVAVDAGTRPDSARAAMEALRARVASLPPLTTVLITHAHWDHVGGRNYFRSLKPAPRFVGRGNYREEIDLDAKANVDGLRTFFGKAFKLEDVLDYRPDVAIDGPTILTIGGTRFDLLPTRGGETTDALLIHLPEHRLVFTGDVMMPYIGAPFSNEGSVDGMIAAIDQLHDLKPEYLLHGHEPLTRVFSSTGMLDCLRPQIVWLQARVLKEIQQGTERSGIHAANLIPDGLRDCGSDVHLAFLVLRENIIDRLVSQNSGYWKNGRQGLDALSDTDFGDALGSYLGLSDSAIVAAADRMLSDGRLELAARILNWGRTRYPDSRPIATAREATYLKLMDKYQQFNPFKVIVYSNEIHYSLPRVDLPSPIATTKADSR